MQPHGITFPGNDFIEIIDEIALKTVESVGCGTVVAADDINDFSADWTGAAADDAAARNDFEQTLFAILGYGANSFYVYQQVYDKDGKLCHAAAARRSGLLQCSATSKVLPC